MHSELPFERERAIADALGGRAVSSASRRSTDVAAILRMAEAVRPGIVHISTDTGAVGVPAMRQLRVALPPEIRLMKAVHVDGPESIPLSVTRDASAGEVPGIAAR